MKSKIIALLVVLLPHSTLLAQENESRSQATDARAAHTDSLAGFAIEYSSPEEALSAISRKEGIQKISAGDIDGFPDIKTGVFWVFTNWKNPAHPAVMKMKVFESNGHLFKNTKVRCTATKAECDKFVSYHQYLNKSVMELYWANKEYLASETTSNNSSSSEK